MQLRTAVAICLSSFCFTALGQTIAPKTILNKPAAPATSPLGTDLLNASRNIQALLAQCPAKLDHFLPTHWSDTLAECFWEQKGFAVLQNGKIVGDLDQGTAAVEIASGFLKGLRLAYTQAVTASTSDNSSTTSPQQNAAEHSYRELLTNGGNVAFTFSYPIFGVSSDAGGYFLINSYARSAGSIKALGESEQFGASTTLSDMNAHLELAAETNGVYPLTGQDKMDLVMYSRVAALDGTSRFNTFLNRSKSSPFAYAQIGAGVRLGGLLTFVVSATKPTDKSLPGAKPTVTVSLSRQARQP